MTDAEIYDALTTIFRDIFDDETIELRRDMTAKDVPEWDSFNHLNIIVAAGQRFGVDFNTSEIDGLECVGDFVRLIRAKLGQDAHA